MDELAEYDKLAIQIAMNCGMEVDEVSTLLFALWQSVDEMGVETDMPYLAEFMLWMTEEYPEQSCADHAIYIYLTLVENR